VEERSTCSRARAGARRRGQRRRPCSGRRDWEEKVEELTRAAQVTSAPRVRTRQRHASDRLEAIYTQQYRWTELVEVLLSAAAPAVGRGAAAILNRVARIYEFRDSAIRKSAFYVLQAAFSATTRTIKTARA